MINHISDMGSICIGDMYVCFCAFALLLGCMFGILVSCIQKIFQVSLWILAHQFNSRMLVSSIQRENVSTSKLEENNW